MKKVESFENYIISIDSDLYHCLTKFEMNNTGTLLVIKNELVVGTITDGDIRKALLDGRTLYMPVKNVMNNDYKYGFDEVGCKYIFDSFPYIFIVPLIGPDRRLLQIFLRND